MMSYSGCNASYSVFTCGFCKTIFLMIFITTHYHTVAEKLLFCITPRFEALINYFIQLLLKFILFGFLSPVRLTISKHLMLKFIDMTISIFPIVSTLSTKISPGKTTSFYFTYCSIKH